MMLSPLLLAVGLALLVVPSVRTLTLKSTVISNSLPAAPPIPPSPPPFSCTFDSLYPNQYVNYFTTAPPVIDGHLDDACWDEVSWTEDFIDILGASPIAPTPRFETRAKMRWDDTYLYIAGYIQETDVWANQTQHDSIIFYDNDFEVFLNPDGTTHYYKEWEMNAINSTWDLCLLKPYLNGGYENSSRVFGNKGWDMEAESHHAVYVDGPVNNPSAGRARYWTVEIAFNMAAVLLNQTNVANLPPREGSYWRINFSRVEYHVHVVGKQYEKDVGVPLDNWVWSPMGVVDMHLPEKWGYIQFTKEAVNTTAVVKDPEWTVRSVAMFIYAAQLSYFQGPGNGTYTDLLPLLSPFAPANTINGVCTSVPFIELHSHTSYTAVVSSVDETLIARIRDDRYLTVEHEW